MKAKFIGILVLILLAGNSHAQQISNPTKPEKQAVITKAIDLLKENYIFPNRVAPIEKFVTQKLATGAYDSLNLETFLESLNADFQKYGNDHHLNISYGPKRVKQIITDAKNIQENKEEKITDEWLQQIRYENFRMRKLERLDGNIGYFNFLSFTPLAVSKQSITSAMNFLLYSNAIIIDLRDNGGGYAQTMNFMLSYFLKDSIQISELRFRKNDTVVTSYTVADSSINKIPDNTPLYILVSNKTSSAAEGFAYGLQQYKRAIIVGEQTKGEGNPGSLFVINDDLYMMIPTAEAISSVSKKSIDGIGVIPDIAINRKSALSRALLDVYSSLAESTHDKDLKQLYQWQLPVYANDLNPEPLTERVIKSVVGNYEDGRKIVFKNGSIYYSNSKGEEEKLNYIGKGVFQNDEKSWLRLEVSNTDKPVSEFKWIWEDGGEPQVVKRML